MLPLEELRDADRPLTNLAVAEGPFANVAWLAFDVAFRPVTPEEIEAPS